MGAFGDHLGGVGTEANVNTYFLQVFWNEKVYIFQHVIEADPMIRMRFFTGQRQDKKHGQGYVRTYVRTWDKPPCP